MKEGRGKVIINYCRLYVRLDLLTEKRGFSLKKWLPILTIQLGKFQIF